ncbi:MAG: hypothetical protein GX452_13795 [Ignavibacteriales bacterium]|nr:hypothetical protein [Ignavibacteriales bacterium]
MTEKAFYRILIILLTIVLCVMTCITITQKIAEKPGTINETAVELAKTITVLRPSFMTASQLESIVKGTGLANYGWAFLEAEKQSGIGADYLLAIAIHESGWGSNDWWKTWNNYVYTGYYRSSPERTRDVPARYGWFLWFWCPGIWNKGYREICVVL